MCCSALKKRVIATVHSLTKARRLYLALRSFGYIPLHRSNMAAQARGHAPEYKQPCASGVNEPTSCETGVTYKPKIAQ